MPDRSEIIFTLVGAILFWTLIFIWGKHVEKDCLDSHNAPLAMCNANPNSY